MTHEKPRHTVLVVDDEAANRELFQLALSRVGYAVVQAEDGEEALERAAAGAIDLVLADVNMPRMDGFDLCAALKAAPATADVPFVFVTGDRDRRTLLRGLELGGDDFLVKPIDISELQARVRNLLLVRDYREHMKRHTAELEARVAARTRELEETMAALRRAHLHLRESTLDTIQRLATAAEFKDTDTAAHIWRMSNYSMALARWLGQDPPFVDNMLYASPMHDVGKIGIPDRVLLKPGKLTPDERTTMEEHTLIGERILSGSREPLLHMAQEIAGGHHERWDGSGYPRGLAGEDIPLSARIVAVADVYDALTSRRVYKEAWPDDRAFELIARDAGTHFDPRCAEAFLAAREEVLKIQRSAHAS